MNTATTITVPQEHKDFAEYYEQGYDAGYSTASWCDMPELGDKIDKHIDWTGLGDTVTEDNVRDYHELLAHAGEENSRQYSPFEFTASEINSLDEWDAQDAWDAYDAGIADGITANLDQRYT